jgi:NAD(P)-dependent dehydrogenase (short-subunit alcohol dehydrogenase family)
MAGRPAGLAVLATATGGGIGRATAPVCAREGTHVIGGDLGARPVMTPRPSPATGVRTAFVAGPEDDLVEPPSRGTIR